MPDSIQPANLLSSSLLSIAVISPDKQCRTTLISALVKCKSGPIREFISYPANISDVAQTLNRDFDVVIVDLDNDQENALSLVEGICAHGQVIVMAFTAKTDPDLLLRSMHAGAREFLTLPLAPHTMGKALARASYLRAALRPQGKKTGQLFIFLGAKGGSGTTTIACLFAASLAKESGQRTLLIDLNLPLGDVAINLGIKPKYSIAKAFQYSRRLDVNFLSALLVKHSSGLFVLAAPGELAPTYVSAEAIDTLLEVARQAFDYVVVDAGSRLDLQREHLFDETTTIYLITQIGVPELRNSHHLISLLSSARSPKLEIVINRYDPRSHAISDENLAKTLTRPPQWKIPNNYAALRRMQNTATSLTEDNSNMARVIREMARAAYGQPTAPEKEKKKGFSFFS